jgi:hypothetical protein
VELNGAGLGAVVEVAFHTAQAAAAASAPCTMRCDGSSPAS